MTTAGITKQMSTVRNATRPRPSRPPSIRTTWTPRIRWPNEEPVSHVSNAIHMAEPAVHGLVTLQPTQSMSAWMRLAIARA